MKCIAVIPAYNEEATIQHLVERIHDHLDSIIVVNDGSTDETQKQAENSPCMLLNHAENLGKATALWRGIQDARQQGATHVLTIDGDGQHSPAEIPLMLAEANNYPEHIIIGARILKSENAPKARRFANHFADFWISWAAGEPIRDTQSGFRIYPMAVFESWQPNLARENGFVFESEVLIEAVRSGRNCRSVPIETRYPKQARHSHFRPVADISRIVIMVAGKLARRGFYPAGLWRILIKRRETKKSHR